ncbi:hypothetical protein HGRIS_009774 [Hohenbuehelia grisea]|uniref:Uncharacterized protein n=1 Tax=Hohenbuehelia grisea TaxID=104357 RepID=A0ABR3J2A1_9AGAR
MHHSFVILAAFTTAPRRRFRQNLPYGEESHPNHAFLKDYPPKREAEHEAPRAVLRQLRRSPSPPHSISSEPEDDFEDEVPTPSPSSSPSSSTTGSIRSTIKSFMKQKDRSVGSGGWKEPQPFEVFRAIERKDVTYLMEVRDRAFPILLRKTGDATPLLHAMRIGQSHRDVAIILLGAFSRWVNHLEDTEIARPKTRVILKALRTNLKLAIDYGLAKAQSDLTASFLQTLIMSEGDKWVRDQAFNVALALRAGTAGKPVQTADAAVRRFATRELGKADLIASLEDYVANATGDLLILGAWGLVIEIIPLDQIPTYYFARDNRVYSAFVERLEANKADIQLKAGKRLKWQLRVLQTALEGRTTTYRRKVELLTGELDEGEGV